MLWSQRTWTEFPADLEAARQSAILPVGATEQHGPHLGTGMDAVLADRLCTAVAQAHRRADAADAALRLLARTQPPLARHDCAPAGDADPRGQGDRRLGLSQRRAPTFHRQYPHVTNAAPLRCALEMLRAEHDDMMIAVLNSATISQRVREAHFADGDDWHANAAETSLMLAVAPEIVRPELVAECGRSRPH